MGSCSLPQDATSNTQQQATARGPSRGAQTQYLGYDNLHGPPATMCLAGLRTGDRPKYRMPPGYIETCHIWHICYLEPRLEGANIPQWNDAQTHPRMSSLAPNQYGSDQSQGY